MTDSPSTSSDPDRDDSLEERIEAIAAADRRLVCSDFDGTLADIVPHPDDATVRSDARRALAALADRPDTDVAVVSGRALDDVAERVGLESVWAAGNHGLEISVDGEYFVHPTAEATSETLSTACRALDDRLADVEGAFVEPKGLTATVHYRQVADEADRERVESAVRDVAGRHDDVAVHDGKQIHELRPALEWDKGRAVEWILETAYEDHEDVHPVYVGDDVSDEPAFAAVEDRGTAVAVGANDRTNADLSVPDPAAVADFLERLHQAIEA